MTSEVSMEAKPKLLKEKTTDPGVFQEMDKFELSDAEKFALSIRLQFPKFSKGFNLNDFDSFIDTHIGIENLVAMGRLSFPNEWQMQLKSKDVREKLVRLGRTKINTRTCWISPLNPSEIRGFIHWIPNAVGQKAIEDILKPYGVLLFMETQTQTKWLQVNSDSRYFGMILKAGRTMDDLPHFAKIAGHTGLLTVKGRKPACFHCKEIGHRKTECKKYRERLSDYCLRKPDPTKKRARPRGKRYCPSYDKGVGIPQPNRKKTKAKASTNASVTNKIQTNSDSAVSTSKKNNKKKQVKSEEKIPAVPEGKTEPALDSKKAVDVGELLKTFELMKTLIISNAENVEQEGLSTVTDSAVKNAQDKLGQETGAKKKKSKKKKKKPSPGVSIP